MYTFDKYLVLQVVLRDDIGTRKVDLGDDKFLCLQKYSYFEQILLKNGYSVLLLLITFFQVYLMRTHA